MLAAMNRRLVPLLLLVALSAGCSGKPRASELAPAIERTFQRMLLEKPEVFAPAGLRGVDWKTCGVRVLKVGIYDKEQHSWPVRATTCISLVDPSMDANGATNPDSMTAVYSLRRNEFGEWVAKFEHWDDP